MTGLDVAVATTLAASCCGALALVPWVIRPRSVALWRLAGCGLIVCLASVVALAACVLASTAR